MKDVAATAEVLPIDQMPLHDRSVDRAFEIVLLPQELLADLTTEDANRFLWVENHAAAMQKEAGSLLLGLAH